MEPRAVNAMTVDVEDYFHVSAFDGVFDRDSWSSLPATVDKNTRKVLDLFDKFSVKSTFFTLGWVAQAFPTLIKEISDRGHEVASHGYSHQRASTQTPEEFMADVTRSKDILEQLIGEPVRGYRAPSFSINDNNTWAFDVLAELGFQYSSSTYPIEHDLYGVPNWPRFCHQRQEGIIEIPIATISRAGKHTGIGGGGFFRLYPYWLSKKRINRFLAEERQPYNFYFHPWEIDPDQPRVKNVGLKSTFRHYVNLARMEAKLAKLCSDFTWKSMSDVYL